jgi:hypothetical protein
MTIKNKLPTYLVPALFAALKVGCRIEAKLRRFLRPLKRPPRFLAPKVLSSTIQRSDLTQTHSPSGLITMHHDAWPMPPISLRNSTS